MSEKNVPEIQNSACVHYMILPLRDMVLFPGTVMPFFVGRHPSLEVVRLAHEQDQKILFLTQKDATDDAPTLDELYDIGTTGTITQVLRLPDQTIKILVQADKRVQITQSDSDAEDFLAAYAVELCDQSDVEDADAMRRVILNAFEQYLRLSQKPHQDILAKLGSISDLSHFAHLLCSHFTISTEAKQILLSTLSLTRRFELLLGYIESELDILQAEKRIRSRVEQEIKKNQREYFLTEQMKAIQRELDGDDEDENGDDELTQLHKKIHQSSMSKSVKERATTELKKLRQMNAMSAEAGVIRNYLDWLISLPWQKKGRLLKNLQQAEEILDEDHYGLEKIKERILEFLAVQMRVPKPQGPVLCLLGAPGVGKTSLGKSIARATGRKFVRIALGGVRDESEIRGHRRTYVGAMPGRLIKAMKKAGTLNPVILLDEIDKMGADMLHGDPASALLEVLDPQQNKEFYDHYLEVDYDLSNVMFIVSANTLNIPSPLMDRLEILRLSGYTEEEKIEIAKRHLIPKQKTLHGLKDAELSISDGAISSLITHYCREAGVRGLEREIAKISRKTVKKIVTHQVESVNVHGDNLSTFSGSWKFTPELSSLQDEIGLTMGLAWTESGGDVLHIEAVKTPGKGKVTSTGKLGEVMQESIQAAYSFIRANADLYGISRTHLDAFNIHLHVPSGAIPKDGPSAGIAIATSIMSILTQIPVHGSVAMTGEITLRGRVMPIGGLKEKLLAARRINIQKVLIPHDNIKDLEEIPENILKSLEIVPVQHVNEVFKHALAEMPAACDHIKTDTALDFRQNVHLKNTTSDNLNHVIS